MGFFSGLLGGIFGDNDESTTSTSSTSSASSTNSNSGNTTLGNGAQQLGAGSFYDGSTSSSININDLSSRDYSQSWVDNSQRWADNSTDIDVADSRDLSSRIYDSRDLSTRVSDSSSRDYSQRWADSSSRQTTITNTGADSARIVELNAALLQAASEQQNDTVRLIARMGADSLAVSGRSATDLFQTASSEATKAWGHTIDAAAETLQALFKTTGTALQQTASAAESVAARGFSITPGGQATAKTESGVQMAAIGAAVLLGAVFLMRKA